MTLHTSDGITRTFDLALAGFSSGVASLGHIISRANNSASNGSAITGVLKKQDTSAFTSSATNGDWALMGEGTDSTVNHGRLAEAGRFTLSSGTLSQAVLDLNDAGSFDGGTPGPVGITGSLGAIDTTNGRALLTITLAGTNYESAVYIVSGNSSGKGEVFFVKVDNDGGTFAGSGLQQSTTFCPSTGACNFTNNALSGTAVVYVQSDYSTSQGCSINGSAVEAGALSFTPGNPTGTISGGFDANACGVIDTPSTNSVTGANYSVAANGRVTITNAGNHPPFLYMVGTNHGYFIGTHPNRVEAGIGEPQVGPIALATAHHTFGDIGPAASEVNVFSGVQLATTASSTTENVTGTTEDQNSIGGGLEEDLALPNFTATLDTTTGRFTFNDGQSGTSPRVGYFINSSRRVVIPTDPTTLLPLIVTSDNQ